MLYLHSNKKIKIWINQTQEQSWKNCSTQLYIEHDSILMHCHRIFERLCYHILFSHTCKRMYFFYKKHRTVNWILLSFALMSTYTLFIRAKTFTTIKEIMIPSLAICGLSFIIMWCSCCLKKILRKRQHWKCSLDKFSFALL